MYHNSTLPQILHDVLLGIKQDVLNDSTVHSGQPVELLDVALKKQVAQLHLEAIDTHSAKVDYARLKNSPAYQDYRELTALLVFFDLQTLDTHERKLAFWLNLYNALVIDGIIHYGIAQTVNEIKGFFRQVAYRIGAYRFSLDDIEHGILRANAGHILIPGVQFGKNDPRLSFIIERVDYRIHFALVCGATSCPPINFYDADQIDTQLDLAARNFLSQNLELDENQNSIKLSKILQWYAEDFGARKWVKLGFGDAMPVLQRLKPYIVDESICAGIDSPRKMKLEFYTYDWSLNAL